MGIKQDIDVCVCVPCGKTSTCTGEMALAVKFVPLGCFILPSIMVSDSDWLEFPVSFNFIWGNAVTCFLVLWSGCHIEHPIRIKIALKGRRSKSPLQVAEFLSSVRGFMIDMAGTCNSFCFPQRLAIASLGSSEWLPDSSCFLPVVSFQYRAWIWIHCNPACFVILGGAEKILCHCSSG